MKIYHGSIIVVEKPTIIASQRLLDFGKGFYTTSNKRQAERWALIKNKRQLENSIAIVSIYDIPDIPVLRKKYQVKVFKKANEAWLDFVFANRKGVLEHEFDIVVGPVANDTLYATLSLYEAGILDKRETVKRLKVHKLFDQISFHSVKCLRELSFVDSFEVV